MYPRKEMVQVRLTPSQAEFIYWELYGLLSTYGGEGIEIEKHDEHALLSATCQLEVGLARAKAVGEAQLEQLRSAIKRKQQEAAA